MGHPRLTSNTWHRDPVVRYPSIESGQGAWLTATDGRRYLDGLSGGAMGVIFGHGDIPAIRAAINEQAEKVSYVYGDVATTPVREQLCTAIADLAPSGLDRVWLTSGGSEANEAMMRAVRAYWKGRGEPERHLFVTSKIAYHGMTFGTLSLVPDRPGLWEPYGPYMSPQASIPPYDPDDPEALLAALDKQLAGGNVAAVMLEPVSGMSYPGYSPPIEVWHGLEQRRLEYGFLLCLDEIVTGFLRCGSVFYASQLPIHPDIITFGKGLGAGFMPICGMIASEAVYWTVTTAGPFDGGHTWDGAPVSCAAGLAVIAQLQDRSLAAHVVQRGVQLRAELVVALSDCSVVSKVRGVGYLLGVSYNWPVASQIDAVALNLGLIVRSNDPGVTGVGAQTTLAPCLTATEADLSELVGRFSAAVRIVSERRF